jgi:hypothetical protein
MVLIGVGFARHFVWDSVVHLQIMCSAANMASVARSMNDGVPFLFWKESPPSFATVKFPFAKDVGGDGSTISVLNLDRLQAKAKISDILGSTWGMVVPSMVDLLGCDKAVLGDAV